MPTITTAQQTAIADLLNDCRLTSGLGRGKHTACSIAAINLALNGRLTDEIPKCMSAVIGHWIIAVQDEMPEDLRNSAAWKQLLPLAAGTGRELESERLAVITDWMYGTALPLAQPVADSLGFGQEWRQMCEFRTEAAAAAADNAAKASVRAANRAAYHAFYVPAYHAAAAGANAAAVSTDARYAVKIAPADCWARLDPVGLLRTLIRVKETDA